VPTAVDGGRGSDGRDAYRDRLHDSGRGPADARRGPTDSAEARSETRSRPPDTSPVRDNDRRFDADAEFKRGVPRPPGSLPDDTGRSAPRAAAARPIELHHDECSRTDEPSARERLDFERGDAPRTLVDRPAIRNPLSGNAPDGYADLLTRPDGTRFACFDGPPRREQAIQGRLRDCGVIATLGSVASHRPDELTGRVRLESDGTYTVTLSEARQTEAGAEPAGGNVELTITSDVPVRNAAPDVPVGAAVSDGAAWSPVLEKALAGVDQTWTLQRRVAWQSDWVGICADASTDSAAGPIREPAPTGYARLNQGTNAWDRAEMLTQLTGQPAEVREFPSGDDEWRINRVIRSQLGDGKPVLVGSRDQVDDQEMLPHNLESGHVYEVTEVEKGKIVLRNPWGHTHPEPMETDEFARNIRPWYTTLP
jgi:hypothetical protein